MYYSGTSFGRTFHSAFTARLVVSDLYPVIFATLLEDDPPFVVKFLWIKSIGLSKKAPLCCLWRSPEIKSEQESIPVGCVQTSAVASTPGSIPYPWIPNPPFRYSTPSPDTLPYPWIPKVPPKGHGTRHLEGTWDQRYPTPSPNGQTDTCENITFLCGR